MPIAGDDDTLENETIAGKSVPSSATQCLPSPQKPAVERALHPARPYITNVPRRATIRWKETE